MEVLGYILAIVCIICGFYQMFKDGREKGIGYLIFEIIGVVILAALGL